MAAKEKLRYAVNSKLTCIILLAFFVSAALFLVSLVLALKKKHPVMLIGLSAAVGIAAGYLLNL